MRSFGLAGARLLQFVAAAFLLMVAVASVGAASARAANWSSPAALPYTPTSDPYPYPQVANDPLGGPTVIYDAGNNGSPLMSTDLINGAWSTPTQISSSVFWGTATLAEGANGDMAAAWLQCDSAGANCVVKAAQRLSGAGWDTPVTVYDPATDGSAGGPYTVSTGYAADIHLAVDGNGNVALLWNAADPGGSPHAMTRNLLSDGTLTPKNNLGYGPDTGAVASPNGWVTLAYLPYSTSQATTYTESPADVQSGTLPSSATSPLTSGDYPAALTTDSTGQASILGQQSGSNLDVSTQNSSHVWQPAVSIGATSTNTAATLTEDAAGDRSVVWGQPATDGSGATVAYASDLAAGAANWSSPQLVADSSHSLSSGAPWAAEDSSGDLAVAWSTPSSTNEASIRPAAGSFDGPTQLQASGPVVINDYGAATVVGDVSQSSDALHPNEATVSVTNPGDQTGTVGSPVSLQIQASDSDAGTLSYSATGLPAGLSIDPSTGLISGTPTTAGTVNVSVTATDASGPSNSASFTWTINDASSGGGGGSGGGGSGGGPGGGGSGSGTSTLPTLTASPGRSTPTNCSFSGPTMPGLLHKEQVPALAALLKLGVSGANITVIERHPHKAPVKKVGEIYSQIPAAGKGIAPCSVHVRLVIYGGPHGLSVAEFKKLQSLAGSALNSAELDGWKITYEFKPADVSVPTVEKRGVKLISVKAHRLLLKVLMPERQDVYYTATMGHGGPGAFVNPSIPAPGTDGALGVGFENLFGESVWSGAPQAAKLVVDTHEIDGSGADNLTYDEQTVQQNSGDGPVSVLSNEAHFAITPTRAGHIFIVAFAPCKVGPCVPIAMDSIPVIRRQGDFDSVLGYRYTAHGGYAGVVPGTNVKAARDRPTAHAAFDLGTLWSLLVGWLTNGSGAGGTTTVSVGKPSTPPSMVYFDGNSLANVGPAAASGPQGRLVFDFSSGLYPLLDSGVVGLPAGRVYEMHDGKAINLIDGSTYDVIAAGAGNVQNGEVFGVIAAGSGNVIAAGAGNAVPGSGYLDGDVYGLQPGMYQISRDGSGNVTATPVKVIAAGSGNVIAAGSGNVIAAGSGNVIAAGSGNVIAAGSGNVIAAGAGNLANGYYDVIAAGSGNVIAAGAGNVIAAGSQNLTGYQALAAALPEAWVGSGPTISVMQNGVMVTNSLVQAGGRLGSGMRYDIPSLANPGQIVRASGEVIAAGSGNLVGSSPGSLNRAELAAASQSTQVINAGSGNVIAAGAGNVIAAGSGNVVTSVTAN